VGDVNSRSIGIELANAGPLEAFPPFPHPQMRALEDLLGGIRERWGIAPDRVIGHSDMAPERKADPGPKFDWRRLGLAGHAVWPEEKAGGTGSWPAFRAAAARAGYVAPEDDWAAVLAAFRLRFRPWAGDAALQAADVALAQGLAAAHPCVDAGGTPA
jgi:N-acetylmuramoyl-L-alanine amidase